MIKDDERKEKLCLFFASDYHFEMISLPYINECLNNNKKVIMITENDLNGTVNKLLSNVNLNEEEKKEITKIDWQNNDLNKFKEIKDANIEGKDAVIFIKGRKSYIENMNKNINNWIKNNDTRIIDCYDVNEIQNDVHEIASKYNNLLSTSGVEKMV